MSAHGSADVSVDVSLPGMSGGTPGAPGGGGGAPPAPTPATPVAQPERNRGTSKAGNARLPDPVGELRFRVSLGDVAGKKIGWFTECTGLQVEWEVYSYDEGGLNDYSHKFRGRAKHQNLVLKRGVTYEDALLSWFQQCRDHAERKDITVELIGPDGKPVRTWQFLSAFPVKWQGPALNAASANAATETLEIAHHGFKENA
jgi:phage tail-like protein